MDICFGLGYNTLATLYYLQTNNLDIKLHIYSPEFDKKLISSLKNFSYPQEFKNLSPIIEALANDLIYKSENLTIEIFNGDAREYITTLKDIDIIYQDAFSSDVNPFLWSIEYFKEIKKIVSNDAIITTYSIATPIRLSIYESGFEIFEYKPENTNRITLAFNTKQNQHNPIIEKSKYIDMELKKQRNTEAKVLSDSTIKLSNF